MSVPGSTRVAGRSLQRAGGFTLIEVAVVIAIIATLLGTLLIPLATQVETARIKDTDRALEEVREALLGYAMTQGRLPCPDLDRDGREDRDGADVCIGATGVPPLPDGLQGFLPWATLGTGQVDAWGRHFLYRVTREFTYAAVPGAVPAPSNDRLDLADSQLGDMRVRTRGDDPATVGVTETRFEVDVAVNVPVVVLSLGGNGFGGTSMAGNVITDPDATLDDERVNRTDTAVRIFYWRSPTRGGAGCDDGNEAQPFCEFDDRIAWISANVIMNRLITAGVLP